MFFTILALTTVLASATNIPANEESKPKDLLCDICLDIVRDLDEWITSDSTLDEIIHFVEGLCSALGAISPQLEQLCDSLVEANLPDIINGLVEENLSPEAICADVVGWCYKPPPTTTAASS